MNSGPFKLPYGHVVANSDIPIHHCLLEPIPSKALTSQES